MTANEEVAEHDNGNNREEEEVRDRNHLYSSFSPSSNTVVEPASRYLIAMQLEDADRPLFAAARLAQLNRNSAIHIIIDRPNSRDAILGSYVRVLLELPTGEEDYVVARVSTTTDGEPYNGFSTQQNQFTTTYLILQLPEALAAINGTQYQLNSISNSPMQEGEFARWLDSMRNESIAIPTREDLLAVGERIRQFDTTRHRSSSHASVMNSVSNPTFPRNERRMSVQGGRPPIPSTPTPGSVSASQPQPTATAGMRATSALLSSSASPMVYSPTEAPVTTVNNNYGAELDVASAQPARPLQRQTTVGRQEYQRMGALNNAGPVSYGGGGGGVSGGGGAAFPPSGVHASSTRSSPSVHGLNANADRETSASVPPPLQTAAATQQRNDTEDAQLERKLRQDVMNHLTQEGVLFPKDTSAFKLSQLRLIERDMIEYLQHVRDEIAGKQENCVVCMDHVPTVILLPCKHKVLCRLCAPSCATCPVCRSSIKEMFEPEEV